MTDQLTNKLTVYLIKERFLEHEEILSNIDDLLKEEFDISSETKGVLYYGKSRITQPLWIKRFLSASFNNVIEQNTDDESKRYKIFSASSKAILLIMYQMRIYALAFGYGWTLLNPGVYEERFGLKITLNSLDSDSLRRIDKKSMTSIPKDTTEQLSRVGSAADFGIDIEQDLIRSITGKSKLGEFGNTITGKDSLTVSVKVDLSNVSEFLETCDQQYISTDYQNDFGWIDQIAEVKDLSLTDALNEKLIDSIKNEDSGKTWMAVPEIVNWPEVLGFSYTSSSEDISDKDDINLSEFYNYLPTNDQNNLSLEILKKRKIVCFSSQTDQPMYKWSAYQCLYCEIKLEREDRIYLLSNGKWYEIEKEFTRTVNDEYRILLEKEIPYNLPIYNHTNENDYNVKTAEENNYYCCMDRKIIHHGGGHNQIEFCDLFTNDKKIIHVKHYAASSVLSHLFSQGVVSGELFLADKDFREKVNAKLPESHRLDQVDRKPTASEYDVVFAVISSSNGDLNLPFFSKVSLKNAKRRLETFGYKVYLQKIQVGN